MQIAQLEFQLDDSIPVQRVLRLRVGVEDVKVFIDQVAARIRKDVSVPGFRKGKASLTQVRNHYAGRISAEAFDNMKRAALEQVLKQLKDEDKPFLPPETLDAERVRLQYGEALEFAVKYLVDPGGMAKNPEDPQGAFNPMDPAASTTPSNRPMGIPAGPKLPVVPGSSGAPPVASS